MTRLFYAAAFLLAAYTSAQADAPSYTMTGPCGHEIKIPTSIYADVSAMTRSWLVAQCGVAS